MTAVRDVVEEQTAHAGVQRQRVLSLVDRLHRDGAISFDQFAAGNILRNEILFDALPSEGVSSYGSNVGHADGSTKADRLGRKLTGFAIHFDGRFAWVGGRKPRGNERRLEDAIFAACGVLDEAGGRRVNMQHASLLLACCIETECMPSLSGITRQLTNFYGASSNRSPAYALGVIGVWLGRLAMHFRLVK